jgi:dTDP-4-dehydrorhamnose 3,5-epimerase
MVPCLVTETIHIYFGNLMMKFTGATVLPEIILITPDVYRDERGHFFETYQARRYANHGIPDNFVQDNVSHSTKGVLRGLHYQSGKPQGTLVWIVQGEVFDVAVDIRRGSPTFGKWVGMTLSSQQYSQIFIPKGFAHGFYVTSETAIVMYKCTDYYFPHEERGIRWDDPALAIDWPTADPILSRKDRLYPSLKNTPQNDLPAFTHTSSRL